VCTEANTVLRAVVADFFFNCWYLELPSDKRIRHGLSTALHMKSLLFVESFDLCPSNQYILVTVIPSCFHFMKMCLCQISLLSRCSPRYLISISGELHIVYMDQRACFFSCCESDVDRFASVSFHSSFFKPVLDCK
jgi:hypothetical protein